MKINLPSSVFATDLEKGVGLLNEAVPIRGVCAFVIKGTEKLYPDSLAYLTC